MTLKCCYRNDEVIEACIDECALGCYAGPLAVSVVIWPKDFKSIGVAKEYYIINDSKKLSEKKRETLVDFIKTVALDWQIVEISNKEIDRIGVGKARDLAIHKAIKKLKIRPGLLVIDGNRFKNETGIAHVLIVKGDSKYQGIAAASILAKCYRDNIMREIHKIYPEYNWEKNKGYGSIDHTDAMRKHGLTKYHRLSYAPCKELLMFSRNVR